MATFWRTASRRGAAPLVAVSYGSQQQYNSNSNCQCEQQPRDPHSEATLVGGSSASSSNVPAGMRPHETGDFYGLFPKRQLWQPALPWPLWNRNWDGREPSEHSDPAKSRWMRKHGTTRHIILVRHGQYDESHKEDHLRVLTPLGRKQAHLTGQRLAEMVKGCSSGDRFTPCNVKVVRVSNLARAKETADIIAQYLPGAEQAEPDQELNEGRPCHNIPGARASEKTIATTDETHPRIEGAFQKYFYRNDDMPDESEQGEKHEFEVIVCHANVIRYFMCRALQLPPEVWLRYCPFNCSLTYITIRATGSVSCRMMGDIGHLSYDAATFSSHYGFNW